MGAAERKVAICFIGPQIIGQIHPVGRYKPIGLGFIASAGIKSAPTGLDLRATRVQRVQNQLWDRAAHQQSIRRHSIYCLISTLGKGK